MRMTLTVTVPLAFRTNYVSYVPTLMLIESKGSKLARQSIMHISWTVAKRMSLNPLPPLTRYPSLPPSFDLWINDGETCIIQTLCSSCAGHKGFNKQCNVNAYLIIVEIDIMNLIADQTIFSETNNTYDTHHQRYLTLLYEVLSQSQICVEEWKSFVV